ncbi:MAG TPA: hypothetical protein VI485_03385 [Vicinamibacterales bacterium]|nr:hypothetical protein [Vicinamibacterales bacterium]
MSVMPRGVRWAAVAAALAIVVAPENAGAQGYCVDAQMKSFVACPPAGTTSPPPLMKEDGDTTGRLQNEPPGGDTGCGRGLGFCCFCHMALATSVRAPAEMAAPLRTSARAFWERHGGVARLVVPSSATNRTMKAAPALREPYATLMKSRAADPRR